MLSAGIEKKVVDSSADLKLLRRIGFYLFILSFPLPNWEFEGMGIAIFFMTPSAVIGFVGQLFHFFEWKLVFLAMGFSLGWLANFTVFFPLPTWARWTSIAAPWIAFFSDVFLIHYDSGVVGSSIDVGMLTFIPFYPWAIGIGLIHYSQLRESHRVNAFRTSGANGVDSADL